MNWFDAPAPAARIAVLRILTGAFGTIYLAVRLPAFLALGDAPARDFEPVGVLWWLPSTVSPAVVTTTVVAALAAGVAFTAGARFRFSGPLFAVALLALTTYRSSFGQLLWFENLVVLHVLVVACAPSADALSLDARTRPTPPWRAAYGWPVRLAALITVSPYVLAGIAKLRDGGWSWLSGETLGNHLAYSAARLEVLGAPASPLAPLLVRAEWLLTPAATLTIAFELAAPVALLGGRVRDVWVVGTWLLHAVIAATMFVVFPYPLALIAFAPLYDLERLVPRRFIRTTASSARKPRRGKCPHVQRRGIDVPSTTERCGTSGPPSPGGIVTVIRVNPASIQSYGAGAQESFKSIRTELDRLVNECAGVHYFGPNAVQFKTQCGQLAADFAAQLSQKMAAIADVVRVATSNIASSLGGSPISISVDGATVAVPSVVAVDFVDVDTSALEALIPQTTGVFNRIETQFDQHLQSLAATDWLGTAKDEAVNNVRTFTASAKATTAESRQKITSFVQRQIDDVLKADRV